MKTEHAVLNDLSERTSLSIHYNIGAKAYSAQNREEDRASKGKGGYGEKIGEERAEEVGGGDRREEA